MKARRSSCPCGCGLTTLEDQGFIKQYGDSEELANKQKTWLGLPHDVKRWFVRRMGHGRDPSDIFDENRHLSQYKRQRQAVRRNA